jgi:DNA mismatch repair protein MutS2
VNAHALSVIEYPRVLALVAERASSALGAERVRGLQPVRDMPAIARELQRVMAMQRLADGEEAWRPEPIPDLRAELARLRVAGSVWSGAELLHGGLLMRSSRVTRETLGGDRARTVVGATLAPLTSSLIDARQQETVLTRALDAEGEVRDEASPELRRIRREVRGTRADLVQLLERAMARLDQQHRVEDMSVTVRNGRLVIPVRREGRSALGGIVHDQSATGGTLFVEPPAAVEAGNRIRELEARESQEVQRILRELTDAIRPLQEGLTAALGALVELDALWARAIFARDFRCASVELVRPEDGFSIVTGRHPLLVAGGGAVVPFDLEMLPAERTLLLSGPNTGGKTVLLKAVGLFSALVQSGIPAPVDDGSRIAVFDDIFADIGDEQSIQASLSTFSAHLRNLGEILARATGRSLALIDELGSGTDPAEGAALGGSILHELTSRGTLTVATTHLGALKLLATENASVINASLQFDEQALAPTYRLIKGIPGRSYGLGIARRLGLPHEVLARAEERLPRGERDVAALLATLELRERELGQLESDAAELRSELDHRQQELRRREETLRAERRELERASRQEARRYLLEARAEVEGIIRELRTAGALDEEGARDARRRVEDMARCQADALAGVEQSEESRVDPGVMPDTLEVGSSVALETLGGREGTVLELREDAAVVAVGAVRMTVPRATLQARRKRAPEVHVVLRGDAPEPRVRPEVDIRGMRADEADLAVQQAIDDAVHADLRSLRIIHGKGTGALRARVDELLRADRRVRAHRLGAWNEGGAGVTVAELA